MLQLIRKWYCSNNNFPPRHIKNLASSNLKYYFIYFNNSFYNTFYNNKLYNFIFFISSFKYYFFMFLVLFLLSISSLPLSLFPSLSLCISLFPNKNDQNPPSPQQTPPATTPNQNPITNPKPTKSTKTTRSAKTQTKPKIISRDPKSDQISATIQIHHLPPPRSTGEKEREPIYHRPTNHHHRPTITITTSWGKKKTHKTHHHHTHNQPQNPSQQHPQPATKPITHNWHKTHHHHKREKKKLKERKKIKERECDIFGHSLK